MVEYPTRLRRISEDAFHILSFEGVSWFGSFCYSVILTCGFFLGLCRTPLRGFGKKSTYVPLQYGIRMVFVNVGFGAFLDMWFLSGCFHRVRRLLCLAIWLGFVFLQLDCFRNFIIVVKMIWLFGDSSFPLMDSYGFLLSSGKMNRLGALCGFYQKKNTSVVAVLLVFIMFLR